MLGFLAGAAAMFATMYSTQAILPEIAADFGETPSRAGLSVSVLVLALIPGAWIWGPLSERIGRRRALVWSSGGLVPLSLAVPLAPDLVVLIVLRALQGLAMAGLLAVGIAYIAEAFVPRYGTRVMGWYTSALILGGLAGRLGVALLAVAVGWRASLLVLAALPLGAALLMRRGLPEVGPRTTGPAPVAGVRGIDPALLGALLAGPALFFSFVGGFTYVRFRLEDEPFGLSAAQSGLVFLMWLVGAVAPLAGRVVERAGWLATSTAALAAALAGTLIGLPDVLPLAVLGLAVLTVGMFIGTVSAQVAVGSVVRTRLGTASAIYYSVYYAAGALGAFVPGVAWESAGWVGVVGCTGAALTLGIAGLLVLAAASSPRPARAGSAGGDGGTLDR
jgi:MFS transporter, YNFM family, putative membrane transport protein